MKKRITATLTVPSEHAEAVEAQLRAALSVVPSAEITITHEPAPTPEPPKGN